MNQLNALRDGALSGILVGTGSFFIKIALESIEINIQMLLNLLLNPFTWLAVIFATLGFVLLQRSMHSTAVSLTIPIMGGVGIVFPIILSVIFLSETLTTLHIIGIVLIITGTFSLGLLQNRKS